MKGALKSGEEKFLKEGGIRILKPWPRPKYINVQDTTEPLHIIPIIKSTPKDINMRIRIHFTV